MRRRVAEPVEPLGARTRGAPHGGLDQTRAGPVVELAVGDASGVARSRAAVTEVSRERRDVLAEQQSLVLSRLRGLLGGKQRLLVDLGYGFAVSIVDALYDLLVWLH